MIHFTCDMCGRPLGPEERRYVVQIHVFPAQNTTTDIELDADTDHLDELNELIEQIDVADETSLIDDTTHLKRLDLCPECSRKFVKSPLGRPTVSNQLDFSKN